MVYNYNNQIHGGIEMRKELKTFGDVSKEAIRGYAQGVCVVYETEPEKYEIESIVGGELEKLKVLESFLNDYNDGKNIGNFVVFSPAEDQVKGGLEAVKGKDGIFHILNKDGKEVYLVAVYKNERYQPYEGGKNAEELANKAKERHDSPFKRTGDMIYYMDGKKPVIDVQPLAPEKQ